MLIIPILRLSMLQALNVCVNIIMHVHYILHEMVTEYRDMHVPEECKEFEKRASVLTFLSVIRMHMHS